MKGPKTFRKYSRKLCETREKLDFGENKIVAVVPKICDMLRKGLGSRILCLDVIKSSPSPVSAFIFFVFLFLMFIYFDIIM